MYRDVRPFGGGASASTPEVWAEMLRHSGRFTPRRAAIIRRDPRLAVIQRFAGRGSRVLDAGCGYGEWVAFLVQEGYRAEGLDYSPELIARLRAEYPTHTWYQGSIQDMPLPSGSYDAIISWGVVEHDEAGPGAALAEYLRVLRGGGVAVITVPVDTVLQRRATRLQFPSALTRDNRFFQYFFTPDELSNEVSMAGFEVVESGLVPQSHEALVFPWLYAKFMRSRMAMRALRAAKHLYPVKGHENMAYCVGRALT